MQIAYILRTTACMGCGLNQIPSMTMIPDTMIPEALINGIVRTLAAVVGLFMDINTVLP